MQVSKLQLYGLGVVARNKPLDSQIVEVVPIEDSPMLDGELTDNIAPIVSKGSSSDGSVYETNVDTTTSLKAIWLPIGISNRVTPPDIRRGETIVLYRFADVDKYYWTTLQYDMKLRKLETAIFAFSNTQKEATDGAADTTYYFEVSTHKKIVHLHTSKSDGEPFVYDFQLNTRDGNFIFQDDIGNFISFDSKNVRLEMKNSEGSHIDMDRKIINIYAPDTINLKADNQINLNAGNSINHTTSHITTKADDTVNTVPTTTTTGNVQINQNLVVDLTTTTSGISSVNGAGGSGRGPIEGSSLECDTVDISNGGNIGGSTVIENLSSPNAISAPNI
jgi:hypothetical protein